MQNVELEIDNDHRNFEENKIQEEWMILSDFHNSFANFCDTITGFDNSLQYWQLQSDNRPLALRGQVTNASFKQ